MRSPLWCRDRQSVERCPLPRETMPTFIPAAHGEEGIGEDASLDPLLQSEVTRGARTELAWQ